MKAEALCLRHKNDLSPAMASATSLQDESDKLYPAVNTTACRGAGVPGSKSVLTWKDAVTLLIVLGSSLGSIVAVYVPAAAVSLGQINQLVVVGFCLAIMAICTARQITLASIMYDVHKGQSSLHDFEALLRNDFWGEHARIRTKAIIFLITTIPLGLSIGYKRFVGGNSSINMPASGGEFGFAMPHGYRRVGLGIGLSMNQYFPYWQDPAVNRTYGFALYVESNTTAGILDTPFASYFSSLQSKVRGEDAILVSAAVNATVSESAPFDMSDLTDNGWKALEKKFTPSWKNETFNDGHFMLWASQIVHNHSSLDVKISNTSRTVLSIWNMNQTDRSQARQLFTNRREAYGTWKITSSNITLQSAEFLPQTPQTRDWSRQKIIQDNMMVTDLQLLREYDYMRYPRATDLDTTPALVSTAIASLIAGTNRYKTTEDFSFWVSEKLPSNFHLPNSSAPRRELSGSGSHNNELFVPTPVHGDQMVL